MNRFFFLIQYFSNLFRKLGDVERLLNEPVASPSHDFFRLAVDGIPTRKHHRYFRLNLADAIERLAAVHPRHDHIKDYQIDFVSHLCDCFNGSLTAGGGKDLIAQSLQHGLAHINDHFFIVNQENGLRSLDQPSFHRSLPIHFFVRYR